MAFYYAVIYALYGIECEVFLDLVETSRPYPTQVLAVPPEKLKQKLTNTIIPTLDAMVEAKDKNEYSFPTPDEILSDPELRRYFRYFPNTNQTSPEYLDFDTL